jgi:hypothetical protein
MHPTPTSLFWSLRNARGSAPHAGASTIPHQPARSEWTTATTTPRRSRRRVLQLQASVMPRTQRSVWKRTRTSAVARRPAPGPPDRTTAIAWTRSPPGSAATRRTRLPGGVIAFVVEARNFQLFRGRRSGHIPGMRSRDPICPEAAVSRAGEGGRRSAVGPAGPRVRPEHRQRTHEDLDARSIPARVPEGTSTTGWHGHGAA